MNNSGFVKLKFAHSVGKINNMFICLTLLKLCDSFYYSLHFKWLHAIWNQSDNYSKVINSEELVRRSFW